MPSGYFTRQSMADIKRLQSVEIAEENKAPEHCSFRSTYYVSLWPGLVLRHIMGQEAGSATAPRFAMAAHCIVLACNNNTRVTRLRPLRSP